MGRSFSIFIPLAVVITLLCGLIYGVGQQSSRQNANDPQIAYSEDIAASLNTGVTPQEIIPPARIDISKSLATFIMVFDNSNELVLSTAEIKGKVPTVPPGVFSYVKKNGEDRVTWAPQKDVRIAAVFVKYNKGYILVGRSLREVEARSYILAKHVGIAWLITLALTFTSIFIFAKPKKN